MNAERFVSDFRSCLQANIQALLIQRTNVKDRASVVLDRTALRRGRREKGGMPSYRVYEVDAEGHKC